jgi:HK97 family phage prohead protease
VRQRLQCVQAEFKADAAKRQITGYASVFNNVDHGGDVVLPGAFTKSIAGDGVSRIKVMRNHETLIGKAIAAEQDTKGLLTVSQIAKTGAGDETLALVEDGALTGMSIGYVAQEKAYADQGGRKIRQLKQLGLLEWSYVDFPMNPAADVVGVKSLDDVCYALDRMQSAVYYLRGLTGIDPDTAARVRALIAELGQLPDADAAEDDEAAAAISSLLTDFTSFLSSARST